VWCFVVMFRRSKKILDDRTKLSGIPPELNHGLHVSHPYCAAEYAMNRPKHILPTKTPARIDRK
jgi:hypothetical protein